jgi:hypothetical protein
MNVLRWVVAAALTLTACGGQADSVDRTSQTKSTVASTTSPPFLADPATVSPSPTASATLTPTPTPTPQGADVRIICYTRDYDEIEFDTPEDAWPYKFDYCGDTEVLGTPSPREQKALQVAYGRPNDLGALGTLYSICAEVDRKHFDYLNSSGNRKQINEITGALMLCPNHPDRNQAARYIDAALGRLRLETQGRVFADGTYRVGKAIQPGTYVATGNLDGCYWERADRNGEIIDNYFTLSARRAQVTIAASDYSFYSEDCGRWEPL